jgi:hypothetical protein
MILHSEQMGSPASFWSLQSGSFGLLRNLFCAVPGAHGEAEEVCHLVSHYQPTPYLTKSSLQSLLPTSSCCLPSQRPEFRSGLDVAGLVRQI